MEISAQIRLLLNYDMLHICLKIETPERESHRIGPLAALLRTYFSEVNVEILSNKKILCQYASKITILL